MFTTRMVRLFAVVLGRDSENVTEELLRALIDAPLLGRQRLHRPAGIRLVARTG